jgi:hypothetical protein
MDSQAIAHVSPQLSWGDRLKKLVSFARSDSSNNVKSLQLEAVNTPVSWVGDLETNCTARWAGLLLRAEQKNRTHWSWTVYDAKTRAIIMDSRMSWARATHGKKARQAAEQAARQFIEEDLDEP